MESHNHLLKVKQIWTPTTNTVNNMVSFGAAIVTPPQKCKSHRSSLRLQVRAQSFRDEGRSSNMVDANLRILSERIEEVRNKERLERSCSITSSGSSSSELVGWNYAADYNNTNKYYRRGKMLTQCFELIGLIAGTAGLTILTSTSFLCFVSLILHLNQ